MTPRMHATLSFVRAFQFKHGYCPSYGEIADGIGLKSKSNVHRIVKRLEERGHIRRLFHKARSIEVIPNNQVARIRQRSAASRKGWRTRRSMKVSRETSRAAGTGLTDSERNTAAVGEPTRAG